MAEKKKKENAISKVASKIKKSVKHEKKKQNLKLLSKKAI